MQSTKPIRPKPPNWPAQSPHTVFIRNLQLLGFDRLEDWPGITPRILSPSSQNQRQRIKAIEWALYHLVARWDPEIARDKLRPFFPPLEPLQSVNLRAALFRILSDLKKNGDLGRETILRKSMLDDCKGEKFDEILAVFSTAVLRKSYINTRDENLAIKLATAQGLTPREYPLLLPLILTYRASLRTLGERQNRIRTSHDQFLQLLDAKKDELDSRSAASGHVAEDPRVDLDALAHETKANWQGSAEWADTLLYGGARSGRDAFLELPFDTAWSQAKQSTVDELRTTSSRPDLVMDLESRVLRQRARLQRWRQYTTTLQTYERTGSASSSTATDAPKTGAPLVFRDHQALTVASIAKAVRQSVDRATPTGSDQTLLFSVSEAMSQINGSSQSTKTQAPIQLSSIREPRPDTGLYHSSPNPIPAIHAPQPTTQVEIPDSNFGEEASIVLSPPAEELAPFKPELPLIESPPSLEHNPRYTLVERTRKSMSLIPPPREKPHPRPRSSRMSFPVNQFETPQKALISAPEFPSRASTPRDELFEDQADYASVFKSRPRIALSPVTSPAVHVSPIGDFDLEADLGQDVDLAGMGSPLASRRRF